MRLTAENTILVLDSSVDLPGGVPPHPGWRVVAQHVTFGDKTFRDHIELSPQEFFRHLARSTVPPQTAHPSPGEFLAIFESLRTAERILAIVLSAELSGTYNSAVLAADARTRVVDSGTVSGGTRLLAEAFQRRLDRGTTDEELDDLARRYREQARFVFALGRSTDLARGGRAGAPAVPTRPVIEIVDGMAVVSGELRAGERKDDRLAQKLEEGSTDDPHLHLGVAHAAAATEAVQLTKRVRRLRPSASLAPPLALGPAIGTHAGPGALGLYWFADDG
jgi:DegV family protein with EDD domain